MNASEYREQLRAHGFEFSQCTGEGIVRGNRYATVTKWNVYAPEGGLITSVVFWQDSEGHTDFYIRPPFYRVVDDVALLIRFGEIMTEVKESNND